MRPRDLKFIVNHDDWNILLILFILIAIASPIHSLTSNNRVDVCRHKYVFAGISKTMCKHLNIRAPLARIF